MEPASLVLMDTPNTFLISDTHFGHSKLYTQPFLTADGKPLRPWSSAEAADEAMIEKWNGLVRPCDKVYHLGDVAIPRAGIKTLERLNGKKVLVAGNHDSAYIDDLRRHFKSVRAYWKIENFVLSHVPIHPCSLRRFDGNIHGHLHSFSVTLDSGEVDIRYLNVCVENTNYSPIAWEDAVKYFAKWAV